MELQVLLAVELESAAAALWYEDQRPGLGDAFLTELHRAFDRIGNAPARFARLENYDGPHEIRRCSLERFPYIVIFLHRPRELLVVAVSHVRRQPLYWLERFH